MSFVFRELDAVVAQLSLLEVAVLRSSIADVVSEIAAQSGDVETSDDPFAAWERSWSGPDGKDYDGEDSPLEHRLFPNAYPHDPLAAADFRRFTQREQRDEKIRCAVTVIDTLSAVLATSGIELSDPRELEAHAQDEAQIEIIDTDLDTWLKTLTTTRLAIAVELGIETSEDADEIEELPDADPRAIRARIYHWLALLSEQLLRARWGWDLEGLG